MTPTNDRNGAARSPGLRNRRAEWWRGKRCILEGCLAVYRLTASEQTSLLHGSRVRDHSPTLHLTTGHLSNSSWLQLGHLTNMDVFLCLVSAKVYFSSVTDCVPFLCTATRWIWWFVPL